MPHGPVPGYLMAFVTTSCRTCLPVWQLLGGLAGEGGGPGVLPLVVVTPSPGMEDAERALAPPGSRLHMSSDTWFMYGVAQAGTCLVVRPLLDGPPPWQEPAPVLLRGVPGSAAELTALVEAALQP